MARGWWELKAWKQDSNGKDVELNEVDLEHIATLIKEGYTSGDITGEDETPEEPEEQGEEA